jgi:hypothetical protein
MSLFKSQGDKARDRLGPERVAFYLDAFQTLDSDGVCACVPVLDCEATLRFSKFPAAALRQVVGVFQSMRCGPC